MTAITARTAAIKRPGAGDLATFSNVNHGVHARQIEFLGQKTIPSFEDPRRVGAILGELARRGFPAPFAVDEGAGSRLLLAHDPAYVGELASICASVTGEAILPTLASPAGSRFFESHPAEVRLSRWSRDVFTSVGKGTPDAAATSVACVLRGLDHLLDGNGRVAFALGRPPHHHAGRDYMGGYCFYNGTGLAALEARERGVRSAVIDVDFHAGNGTQDLLYRSEALFCSIHGDPHATFPYHAGFADETGEGPGEGLTLNLPLALGSGWLEYAVALDVAVRRIVDHAPDILIVSLGVDTSEHDPIGKFRLTSDDFLRLGAKLAAIDAPTLFVMEGGYDLATVGLNVANVLEGFFSGRRPL